MKDNNLQQRLKTLMEEIAALKAAKKAGLLLQCETYIDEEFNFATGLSKITYADGVQPIITTNYSDIKGTMFAPVGNEQYFYYPGGGAIGRMNLQSTRKILSIEWVHA